MLARVVRSGVVEATHEGAVAVVAPDGVLIAADGDIDRPYFIRSAAKPFQARAVLDAGATFTPEQLAIGCASHGGQPIHVAYVHSMLLADGLDQSALQCPPDWPISGAATDRLIMAGHKAPQRAWHNCSGKHAAMLRACVAAGWSLETYLDPSHPLQIQIRDEMSTTLGGELGEPGIDGCGAPVYQVTTRQLAMGYAILASDFRYAPIRVAMQRFGSLVAHTPLLSAPSRYWDVAAKGGAEGCIGLAARGRYGIALKSFDGGSRPLGPAVLDVMCRLGVVPELTLPGSAPSFEVSMFGGGNVVGRVESMVSLS